MAAPAPPRHPVAIARPPQQARPAGTLPAPASSNKTRSPAQVSSSTKSPASRLKVIVRRLAPGLTELEFYSALGDEWKTGGSKVDWASFRPGKISRDVAKPSRPSRAYLHLRQEDDLISLSAKVRDITFADVKGTSNDPALLGPPSVEFAPYGRIPSSRTRKDGRQGTIDQDPEFIDFLESLTNPATKALPTESSAEKEVRVDEKVVTPLIQYLRDKKANRGKEPSTQTKAAKHARQESKEAKPSQSDKKQLVKASKDSSQSEKKATSATKIEKIAKDAVKSANKQASAVDAKNAQASSSASSVPAPAASSASLAPRPERRRERGSASAAAKILQRDLGLAPGSGRRKRDSALQSSQSPQPPVQNAVTTTSVPDSGPGTASHPAPSSTTPVPAPSQAPPAQALAPSQSGKPPTGPSTIRNPPKLSMSRKQPVPPATSTPISAPTATQAFLKHANPSQGITEPLLEEAFAAFGAVSKVEIDKKKGFAYVDFAVPEGLQRAVAASPVRVAQGSVVVLERKTGASLQNRNAKGGSATPGIGAGGRGTPSPVSAGRGGRSLGGRNRGSRMPNPPSRATPTKIVGNIAETANSTSTKPQETTSAPFSDALTGQPPPPS